jgi:hypothetical protein
LENAKRKRMEFALTFMIPKKLQCAANFYKETVSKMLAYYHTRLPQKKCQIANIIWRESVQEILALTDTSKSVIRQKFAQTS